MAECSVVTNISLKLPFNSNLKALGRAIYISNITATVKFINQIALLERPGGNTPQDTNCTATCLLSRKLFKLDEPDMQDTAGEAGTNS